MNIIAATSRADATVWLDGRFDAHGIDPTRRRVESLIDHGHTSLVVDLHGVVFIDTSAVAFLQQLMTRCRAAAGDLRLARVSQPVAVILDLMRLDRPFPIVSTLS